MAGRWVYPLDPACPKVRAFRRSLNDPITVHYGVADDLAEDFERSHRARCERCKEYGLANVEVDL